MWGSLAGKINEQSGGLLTKIGDAVAPVLDNSIVEYYDEEAEDGSYYDEDEDSSYYSEGEMKYEDDGDYEEDVVHFDNPVSAVVVNHHQEDGVDETTGLCAGEEQTNGNNETTVGNERDNGRNIIADYNDDLSRKCLSIDEHDHNNDFAASGVKAGAVHIEADADNHSEIIETNVTRQPSLCALGSKSGEEVVRGEQDVVGSSVDSSNEGSQKNDVERSGGDDFDIVPNRAEEVQEVLKKALPDTSHESHNENSEQEKVHHDRTTEVIKNIEKSPDQSTTQRPFDFNGDNSTAVGSQLSEERELESSDVLKLEDEEVISQNNGSDNDIVNDCDDVQMDKITERATTQNQPTCDDSARQRERFMNEKRHLLGQFERELEQQRRRFEEEKSELQRIAQSHIDECLRVKLASKSEIDAHKASKDEQILQAQRLIEEADARADAAEEQLEATLVAEEMSVSQAEKHYARLMKEKENKIIKIQKLADDKAQELQRTKSSASDMRSMLSLATTENHQMETKNKALEREIDELRVALAETQAAMNETQRALAALEDENHDMGGLQMELRLMKEAHEREMHKSKSNSKNTASNLQKIMSERDAAIQEGEDAKRQLAQVIADLELSQKDHHHALLSCENMQRAIEAFQAERDAENALMEEQRADAEAAMKAAHAASLDALKRSNDMKVQDVERAANNAVRNSMNEIAELEQKVEEYRRESNSSRKSLDEAIHRLQATQEDVIDRALMKNILLDWHLRRSKKERRDILEVMASLLHFTEEEKSKVGMAHVGILDGGLGKVVGVVAAPLPPSKLNPDKIEGDDLREKWVNFLIAESGEDA